MIAQNHTEPVPISEEKNETKNEVDLISQNDHQCKTLAEKSKQISPMEWWKDRLKSPRFVLAPMVDASELAWRLLARKHGADLTYSPMFHACLFAKDPIYRERAMQTCKEDRPFIVQFCANDPDQLVEAGLLVQDHCDAVDINLGCPQAIARRGRYGAFLQDDWDLISKMVSSASKALSVPVTCKVRVFEDIERTVEYGKMLEFAGAFALTVHGRTREQKGPATGKANWEHIRAVRRSVQIPVIANGNVECVEDVYMCFQQTGCHAVMTAEGSLHNPAVFHTSAVAVYSKSMEKITKDSLGVTKRRNIEKYETALKNMSNGVANKEEEKVPWPEIWTVGPPPPVWEPGLEYLELVSYYPCPFSYIRGHLFKLLHHCLCLPVNYDLRTDLAKSSTLDEFKAVVLNLRDRFLPYHLGKKKWPEEDSNTKVIASQDSESRSSPWPWYPPWLCQPYIRPTLAEQSHRLEHRKINVSQGDEPVPQTNGNSPNTEECSEEIVLPMKRPHPPDVEDKGDGRGFGVLSKRKLRQMQKKAKGGGGGPRVGLPRCALCLNPMGLKCAFKFCRSCCKNKCIDEVLDCEGHRFMVKAKKIRDQKNMRNGENSAKDIEISSNHETLKCSGKKYNNGTSPIMEKNSEEIVLSMKIPNAEDDGDARGFGVLSKKKLRQKQKKAKGGGPRVVPPLCALCVNPMGLKCAFKFCRPCCKNKCIDEVLDCEGHRFKVKSRKIKDQKNKRNKNDSGKDIDISSNHETPKCSGKTYQNETSPSMEKSSEEIVLPKKRPHPQDVEDNGDGRGFGEISKKKLKKMQKKAKRGGPRVVPPLCALCVNPMGLKCAFKFCRPCCKNKCIDEVLDCEGHRFKVKSRKIKDQKNKRNKNDSGKDIDISSNHETLKCSGKTYQNGSKRKNLISNCEANLNLHYCTDSFLKLLQKLSSFHSQP